MKVTNQCKTGRRCEFAHTKEEQMYHPVIYKTKICREWPNCTKYFCPFAHGVDDIRKPDSETQRYFQQRRPCGEGESTPKGAQRTKSDKKCSQKLQCSAALSCDTPTGIVSKPNHMSNSPFEPTKILRNKEWMPCDEAIGDSTGGSIEFNSLDMVPYLCWEELSACLSSGCDDYITVVSDFLNKSINDSDSQLYEQTQVESASGDSEDTRLGGFFGFDGTASDVPKASTDEFDSHKDDVWCSLKHLGHDFDGTDKYVDKMRFSDDLLDVSELTPMMLNGCPFPLDPVDVLQYVIAANGDSPSTFA